MARADAHSTMPRILRVVLDPAAIDDLRCRAAIERMIQLLDCRLPIPIVPMSYVETRTPDDALLCALSTEAASS